MLIVLSVLACTSIERQFWTLTKTGQWFETVETAFTEKEWYDNFCVTRSTFDYIVKEIQDEIVRKDITICTCSPKSLLTKGTKAYQRKVG